MKKIIGLLVFLGLVVFVPARADQTLYGFMDGKIYDESQKLVFICFQDGSCLDSNNKEVFITVTFPSTNPGVTTPAIPTPKDICANLEGVQTLVPGGFIIQGDNCVLASQSPIVGPVGNAPVPQAPILLPAYTAYELQNKIGYFSVFPNRTSVSFGSSCGGNCSQYDYQHVKIYFNNQVVWSYTNGTATGIETFNLTPDTDYSYQIIYSETGRQDTILTKSFHTLGN